MSKPTNRARRWGDGRVAFIRQKDLFRSLVEAGHPISSIYADHGAALGIGYTQFARYVRKYLLDATLLTCRQPERGQVQAASQVPPAPLPPASAQQRMAGSGSAVGAGPAPGQRPAKPILPGFQHDPNSGNDRDDLI